MLVGLVAVAIPVAVHFVGRRPPRVILLPTARFAEGAEADTRARSVLRRVLLMASRVAVVALLVLALAGPHLESASPSPLVGEGQGVRGASAAGATGCLQPASTASALPVRAVAPVSAEGTAARAPIKVLVVDAADEKDLHVRSADLVAAALAGDTLRPKKVWRRIDFRGDDRCGYPSFGDRGGVLGGLLPSRFRHPDSVLRIGREVPGLGARRRRPAL